MLIVIFLIAIIFVKFISLVGHIMCHDIIFENSLSVKETPFLFS